MTEQLERSRLDDPLPGLEAVVDERTRELAATVAELESFTYSVAHDLRAPLRAIHSFGSALLEDHGHIFEGEALDYMQRICRASERMSQLIDDLLKLSKVGRGEIERRPADLSAMAAEIGAHLSEQEPGRTVRLDVQPGIVVPGDGRLLMIALENLLGNAWKFTRRRKEARIRMAASEGAEGWRIDIADNGTGFDIRYRHKLFAPFQRLHRAEEFEGTGIGLVTVARIMARHGGRVTIDSVEGEGTTASLHIPSAAPSDG